MTKTIWGYHLVLNLSKCSPKLIRCQQNIIDYANLLVKRIDMIPYGRPQVIHFGEADKAGFTLVQLIQTSNIMGHFAEESNSAYVDVFSCKKYDLKVVEEVTQAFFQPEIIETTFIERGYQS